MIAKIIYIISVIAECVLVPLFIIYASSKKNKEALIFKSVSSVILIIIGICSISVSGRYTTYSKLIIASLVFAIIGDIVIYLLSENRLAVLGAGAAFLISNILLISACGEALSFYTPEAKIFDWRTVTALLIAVFSCFVYYVIADVKLGKLVIPVTLYSMVSTVMLLTAIQVCSRLFLEGENNDIASIFTLGLGSVLFFVFNILFTFSDLCNKEKKKPVKVISQVTYYVPQILILTSMMFIFGIQK